MQDAGRGVATLKGIIMKCLFIILLSAQGGLGQDFKAYDQTIPGSSISIRLKPIGPGKFTMGSPPGDKAREPDETPQKVIEVSAFWMGATEVTFAQWDAFFKDNALLQNKNVDGVTRPTPQYIDLTWGMGRDGKQPSNSLSHQAAMMYCKWLYSKTGNFFRLPTEAEWEYACRAGSTNLLPFGNDPKSLKDYGYFKDNSEGKFHNVGEKKPNAWGLYDLLGNLSEWTMDQYDAGYFQKSSPKDPLNPPAAKYPKVLKGGSYQDEARELRCANRIPSQSSWNQRDPQMPKSRWWLTDAAFTGFRVVRPFHQPTREEIEKFYSLYLK